MSSIGILVGHAVHRVTDVLVWAKYQESTDRKVAHTTLSRTNVSTVFLGIDHNFLEGGTPLWFETMVFGGPLDGEQHRCQTWKQAEAMHEAMCARVKAAQAKVASLVDKEN